MRILFLNQFFPPDHAPTGAYLHEMARTLAGMGHEVHVVASRARYDPDGDAETSSDGSIRVWRVPGVSLGNRSWVRTAVSYLTYVFLGAITALRLPRPDVVVALTTPPYVGLLGHFLAVVRRSAHAHWIMDVYPDVLWAHGSPKRGFLSSALRGLARLQFRGARAIVAIGPRMQARLRPYVTAATELTHVPLWIPAVPASAEDARGLRDQRSWTSAECVLMYSGNMGRGHSFSEFLAAAERLGPHGPRWAFVGAGPGRREIERFATDHPGARIELHAAVAQDNLLASLASADVHLISMRPGWEGLIVPSKLQAAFAVGRPVIYVGPSDAEVALWIHEAKAGWVVPAGDVNALVAAVREAQVPADRGRRGQAAQRYAAQHFDAAENCRSVARSFVPAGK